MFGPQLLATYDQGKGNGKVNLELGLVKDEDTAVKQFSSWLNDNRVRYFMLMQYPSTVGQERDWVKRAGETKDSVTWCVYASGELVGSISLESIDYAHSHAEIGILLGDKQCWGKGIATVAEMLVADFAFHCIVPGGLSKLYAHVLVGNEPSRRALKHTGFGDVGILRREHFAHGKWFDIWIGDLLREEWLAEREERFRSAGVTHHDICPGCEDLPC